MSDQAVQPAAEATPGLTQWERVVDTFSAPSKTFTDIKTRPQELVAAVRHIRYSRLRVYAAVNSKIGMRQVVDNQIRLSPKSEERLGALTPEQRESQMKISTTVTQVIFIATPVFLLATGAVIALVLWGTINFGFGGRQNSAAFFPSGCMPVALGNKNDPGVSCIYVGTAPEIIQYKKFRTHKYRRISQSDGYKPGAVFPSHLD